MVKEEIIVDRKFSLIEILTMNIGLIGFLIFGWNIKLFTNDGWALATDPWGDTDHWLPPRWRLQSGPREGQVIDQIYCFTRENGKYRYEVAMQQTVDE